jgi:hypothetical protein
MCRWLDRLSQLTPEQQAAFLQESTEINAQFAVFGPNDGAALAVKALAEDSAYIKASRPKEGVGGLVFDENDGLWKASISRYNLNEI